jgi:hypothetical protein
MDQLAKTVATRFLNRVAEVRAGQYFVLVDTTRPGGELVTNELYRGSAAADKALEALHHPHKSRVQVIDAVYYGPAEKLLRTHGMR